MKVLVMKFHDLNTDHVSFVYNLFDDKNIDIKNLVRELLRKKTLIIAKPYLESLSLHS